MLELFAGNISHLFQRIINLTAYVAQLVPMKTCCPILDIIIILGIFFPLTEVFWCLEEVIPELLSALSHHLIPGQDPLPTTPHNQLLLACQGDLQSESVIQSYSDHIFYVD